MLSVVILLLHVFVAYGCRGKNWLLLSLLLHVFMVLLAVVVRRI